MTQSEVARAQESAQASFPPGLKPAWTSTVVESADLSWADGVKVGDALKTVRTESWRRFSDCGLPTTEWEDWKYTNITPLSSRELSRRAPSAQSSGKGTAPGEAIDVGTHLATFINGSLSSISPAPEGMHVCSLRKLSGLPDRAQAKVVAQFGRLSSGSSQPLSLLNTAAVDDALVVVIDKGCRISSPLRIDLICEGQGDIYANPRVFVLAEEHAEATLIEYYRSSASTSYVHNTVTEVFVEPEARVCHLKLQCEDTTASHLSTLHAELGRSSRFVSHVVNLGGGLVRNEIQPILSGEAAECHLYGVSVVRGDQHVDNTTILDHAKPHCPSDELYKGVYFDRARGVFSGTIIVRPDAQKTNAIQSNNSLLMSNEARVETRPQLKIWADDVKCTHGATVGQLDDEGLFYMRARGIGRQEAQRMLTLAFAHEVTERIEDETVRECVTTLLDKHLNEALQS